MLSFVWEFDEAMFSIVLIGMCREWKASFLVCSGRVIMILRGHGQLLFPTLAKLVETKDESDWQTCCGCETGSKHPGIYIGVASPACGKPKCETGQPDLSGKSSTTRDSLTVQPVSSNDDAARPHLAILCCEEAKKLLASAAKEVLRLDELLVLLDSL